MRVLLALFSLFMISYPLHIFIKAFLAGSLFISVGLLAMVFVGVIAFYLFLHPEIWRP